MTIITEQSLRSFEFWSGAKDNADELTIEQFDELENKLEELYPDGMTETQLNDLMWFDFDTICEWLGYPDEEHLKAGVTTELQNELDEFPDNYWETHNAEDVIRLAHFDFREYEKDDDEGETDDDLYYTEKLQTDFCKWWEKQELDDKVNIYNSEE